MDTLGVHSCFGTVVCFRVLFTSIFINLRQSWSLSFFKICTSFCQISWWTHVKKRGKYDVLYLYCHPPVVPKCRVFCWQVVCARFYHTPFISSVAENNVLHHCYVVFNAFWCLHTHFSPYSIHLLYFCYNLYKLIVSEMDSVYYSSLFLLLQWIMGKKWGEVSKIILRLTKPDIRRWDGWTS